MQIILVIAALAAIVFGWLCYARIQQFFPSVGMKGLVRLVGLFALLGGGLLLVFAVLGLARFT